MTRFNPLPHQLPRHVDAGIYGLILGSSIIVAASAEHPGQPGLVEVYLCVTATVFFLAHVYARVIGSWIEGEIPSGASVIGELRREWPMVSAQLLPALFLLLGALGVLAAQTAMTAALAVALGELFVAVAYACWRAHATLRQTATSLVVATLFAAVLVLLKIFVHG
jgi:multidrug transporter EmrE-like cation transporter